FGIDCQSCLDRPKAGPTAAALSHRPPHRAGATGRMLPVGPVRTARKRLFVTTKTQGDRSMAIHPAAPGTSIAEAARYDREHTFRDQSHAAVAFSRTLTASPTVTMV